jgi:hypothetical protein
VVVGVLKSKSPQSLSIPRPSRPQSSSFLRPRSFIHPRIVQPSLSSPCRPSLEGVVGVLKSKSPQSSSIPRPSRPQSSSFLRPHSVIHPRIVHPSLYSPSRPSLEGGGRGPQVQIP